MIGDVGQIQPVSAVIIVFANLSFARHRIRRNPDGLRFSKGHRQDINRPSANLPRTYAGASAVRGVFGTRVLGGRDLWSLVGLFCSGKYLMYIILLVSASLKEWWRRFRVTVLARR
jgi:hypothetical protein